MNTSDSLCSELSIFWDQNKSSTAVLESDGAELLEKLKAELRQNYQFALFSVLPGLSSDIRVVLKLGKKLGLKPATAAEFSYRLWRAGLWKIADNHVETNFEYLNLGDISVKDYLAMTVTIIAHLSEAKSYEYDTLSLVTNRTLVRQFVVKVNQALKELHEKSHAPETAKECLFSWSHTGVIELEYSALKNSSEDFEK